jgi:hypothetical protein
MPEHALLSAPSPAEASQASLTNVDSSSAGMIAYLQQQLETALATIKRQQQTNARLASTNAMLVDRLRQESENKRMSLPSLSPIRVKEFVKDQDHTFGTGEHEETEDNMQGFDVEEGGAHTASGQQRWSMLRTRTLQSAMSQPTAQIEPAEGVSMCSEGAAAPDSAAAASSDRRGSFSLQRAVNLAHLAVAPAPVDGNASLGRSGRKGWLWLRSILVSDRGRPNS